MISVVIAVRDEERHLGQQLAALAREQTAGLPPLEIVIVDHGSTDRTVEIAEGLGAQFPRLRVVDGSGCRGRSDLRNLGVEASSGDWIAFVDGDDLVAPGWLEAMVEARPRSTVLTGALVRVPFEWQLGDPVASTPFRSNFAGHTILASGNGLVRRDVYREVGGFDPEILHRVDVELSLRLERAGHPPFFVPGALLYYREKENPRRRLRQTFQWERSAVAIYRRHRDALDFAHSNRNAIKHWIVTLATVPYWAWRPGERERRLSTLAALAGRLVGSIEQRVLWL